MIIFYAVVEIYITNILTVVCIPNGKNHKMLSDLIRGVKSAL